MKFTKTTLQNGVRVITAPMNGNPTVTVLVGVATGSFYELPEESGISHFLEHMCFKGTQKRPDVRTITTELDSIGAAYNAFTSTEMTGYWAKADAKHFEKIADVVSDIFKHSIFPDKEIEKEKGVVLGEIDMYADDPQQKISDALTKHLYKGEPAERDVLGTKETVKAINRDALVSYRKLQYVPSNIVVTIAGGVSHEKMIEWAKVEYGSIAGDAARLEFPTRSRDQKAPETVFIDKDTDQAHIILAWRSFDRSNPDRYAARIARNILKSGMSSRLYIRLRDEMGSGYYIGAGHSTHKTFGDFSISTGTTHERVPEIISAILEETKRLKSEIVSEPELAKIKEFMRAHRLMGLETSESVAEFCSEQELLEGEIKTPEELEAIYHKVTAEDVIRVANIIFNDERLTVAVLGKGIDKDAIEKILRS